MDFYFKMGPPISENQVKKSQSRVASPLLPQLGEGALHTPFFQSLSLYPLETMEELYRRADKYLMLEDNVCASTQTVMITSQSAERHKPYRKKRSKSKGGQRRDRKRSHDQSQKRESPHSSPP